MRVLTLSVVVLLMMFGQPAWAQDSPEPAAPDDEQEAPARNPRPSRNPSRSWPSQWPRNPHQPAVESESVTSVDTGVALADALASWSAIQNTGDSAAGDVSRLEAELSAAMERESDAQASMATSAADVYAAYGAHIGALEGESAAEVARLSAERATYAP